MADAAFAIELKGISKAFGPVQANKDINIAVPKEFKRGTNAAGTIMGASPYRNNNNPRTVMPANQRELNHASESHQSD